MDVFLSDIDVSVVVPLLDGAGNQLAVDSVQYIVTDGNDAVLVPLTALAAFVAETPSVTVLVPAATNTLDPAIARDLRTVELHCMIAGNVVVLQSSYAIENSNGLIVGGNTFQGLTKAEFTALDIPGIPGWDGATTRDRTAALVEARLHICQLNFMELSNNKFWGQNSLNFVPEGTFVTPYVGSAAYMWGGNLAFVTPQQFAALPPMFIDALCRAQVAEADFILAEDPYVKRRTAGLILDTTGETKQMFRTAKPLDLPVCKRALRYVSNYITFAIRANRI